MELDYYLFKNKIKHKDFAKKIGIQPHHLSALVHKKVNPNLITAIKIYDASHGQISYKEMVRLQDRLAEEETKNILSGITNKGV